MDPPSHAFNYQKTEIEFKNFYSTEFTSLKYANAQCYSPVIEFE